MSFSQSTPAFELKKGILMLHGDGIGTVTRKMVFQRAVELASINGSSAISKSDWEQAKRELTGESEIDPNQVLLESAPESERWDPVHGSTGTAAPVSPSEDEDADGYSDSAKMVEEGISEASHEQMLGSRCQHPGPSSPKEALILNRYFPNELAGRGHADILTTLNNQIPSVGSAPDPELQRAEVALIDEDFITIRRHLHRHPELSGKEIETTAYVGQYLSEHGIPYKLGQGGVGIVSDLAYEEQGISRIIALRADLDALPIQEENDTDYRSERIGVMHACGHDAHTTMLIATLAALRSVRLPSRCRGIFQSSEESGQGALDMVKAGAMQDVAAIIALHVDPNIPWGTVAISSGPQTASCQDFAICVKGVGGHAARPHLTIDPIATAAQLVTLIYQTIPRGMDMNHPVVVTVSEFLGGNCTNVIPESANLRGTLRALTLDAANSTRERLRELCTGMALSSRAEITIHFERQLPGVVNDPVVTKSCLEAARSVVGDKMVLEAKPSMGAEDFADYLSEAPGCMMRLGVRDHGKEIRPLHTPTFDIAEEALLIGAKILVRSFFSLSSDRIGVR